MGDHSHSDMNPILALFLTVAEAIAEVFLVCLAGYILARRGILDGKMRKMINRINVTLFTPALLFSKVAFALTPDKLAELWIVPLFFFIVTGVSAMVAWALAKLFRIKRNSHVAFAIACGCFANSNSLPIALMQSLVVGLDALKWGDEDTRDQMLGRALSYLTLYSTLGIVLRWSVGVKLLSVADTSPDGPKPSHVTNPPFEDGGDDDDAEPTETSPLLGRSASQSSPSEATIVAEPESMSDSPTPPSPRRPRLGQRTTSRPGDFSSFPNTPRRRAESLASIDSDDADSTWHLPLSADQKPDDGRSSGARLRRWWRHRLVRPIGRAYTVVVDFMTVPLYAALLSIIVACIPPVQSWLEDLKPVVGSLKSAGNCSVPLTLVVLGGFMHQEDPDPPSLPPHKRSGSLPRPTDRPSSMRRSTDHATSAFPGETRTIIVALLSRMIITPLLLLPLLAVWSIKTHNVADDPCFLVTATLLAGSPPAITLAQITEAAAGDFERLLSRTLLIAYTLLTPPTTILLVLAGVLMGQKQGNG